MYALCAACSCWFLTWLNLWPESGYDMFLQNTSSLSMHYMALYSGKHCPSIIFTLMTRVSTYYRFSWLCLHNTFQTRWTHYIFYSYYSYVQLGHKFVAKQFISWSEDIIMKPYSLNKLQHQSYNTVMEIFLNEKVKQVRLLNLAPLGSDWNWTRKFSRTQVVDILCYQNTYISYCNVCYSCYTTSKFW